MNNFQNFNNQSINKIFQEAFVAHQNGQLEIAQRLYEKILSININHFDALHLLGVLALQINKPKHAVALISKALTINSTIATVYNNLGLAFLAIDDLVNAEMAFNRAIELDPQSDEANFNKGNVFLHQSNFRQALFHFNKAILINPLSAPFFNNRGQAFRELNEHVKALNDFTHAIQISPTYEDALINQGNMLQELGHFAEALNSYNKVLKNNDQSIEANWNKSLLLLLLDDYEQGFKLYEWRWMRQISTTPKRQFEVPLWLGDANLSDKTILIHAEQGLGDSIQFCRYIKKLSALGARVILEDVPALKNLFTNLEGVDEFVEFGQTLPRFDYHCPMMSLPLALNIKYESIQYELSYIKPDPIKVAEWAQLLGKKNKLRIGICWSSVSTFQNDTKRSMSFQQFSNALPVGHAEYISLQKVIKPADRDALLSRPDILNFESKLVDMSDTAALIANLDFVVSTCTSIPHLSAALGIRTYTLLSYVPDWRWGMNREDSNYYPTMKLIRQNFLGNWQSPIQKIYDTIKNYSVEINAF